jgi:hypothetical protein
MVDEMDQTFSMHKGDEIHTEFYLENLKGRRDHFGRPRHRWEDNMYKNGS